MGLPLNNKQQSNVCYKNVTVGDYVADLIVEGKVLLELKTIAALVDIHSVVCMNYLRVSNLPVCVLINFAKPRLEWKRLVGDSYINQSIAL